MLASAVRACCSAAVGMIRSRTGTSRAPRYSALPSETHVGAPSSRTPIATWLSSWRVIRPRNGSPARTELGMSSIRVEATFERSSSPAYVGKVIAPRWSSDPPGTGEGQRPVELVDAVAHRRGHRRRLGAGAAVEDAQHTAVLAHGDGGQ